MGKTIAIIKEIIRCLLMVIYLFCIDMCSLIIKSSITTIGVLIHIYILYELNVIDINILNPTIIYIVFFVSFVINFIITREAFSGGVEIK